MDPILEIAPWNRFHLRQDAEAECAARNARERETPGSLTAWTVVSIAKRYPDTPWYPMPYRLAM